MITEELYNQASVAIEIAHSEDPKIETDNGKTCPAEVLYSRRMLSMLEIVSPKSTYILKLAVQCQHLKRWGIPRVDYPFDRRGYHQWRRVVMEYQLQYTMEILMTCGIEEKDILLVADALRNHGNKMDADAQIIMDTACLVFLKYYFEPFAAKHEQTKVADILKKTQRKMSDHGLSLMKSIGLSPATMVVLNQTN